MVNRNLIVPLMNKLSEYQSREVEWLWPGRVPVGKLTMLCGDPGMGKSFICMDMAARVSAGLAWPEESWGSEELGVESGEKEHGARVPVSDSTVTLDASARVSEAGHLSHERSGHERQNSPGSVLVMSAEDDPFDTLRPRVERAGGDLNRVVLLHSFGQYGQAGAWVPTLDDNIDVIEKALAKLERPRLVVIDPVSAFLGRVNSYSNASVRAVLDRLSDVAASYRVAIVCVTHVNKAATVRAAYRVMGSLAFAASPRMVWRVGKLKDGRRGMVAVKSNLAGVAGSIAFGVEGGRVVWSPGEGAEFVEVVESVRGPGPLEKACGFLEEVLSAGPRGAGEVMVEAERLGFSVMTMRRAREVCGVEVRREGRGWVWGMGDGREVSY